MRAGTKVRMMGKCERGVGHWNEKWKTTIQLSSWTRLVIASLIEEYSGIFTFKFYFVFLYYFIYFKFIKKENKIVKKKIKLKLIKFFRKKLNLKINILQYFYQLYDRMTMSAIFRSFNLIDLNERPNRYFFLFSPYSTWTASKLSCNGL